MPSTNPLLQAVERSQGGRGDNRSLEQAIETEALRLAKERLSSGPYRTSQLRQMGHPYSRRRPSPPILPAIINVQTGRFRAGWRIRARLSGSHLTLDVENVSPEAKFLLYGTTKMIARPYELALRSLVQSALPKIVEQWLRK